MRALARTILVLFSLPLLYVPCAAATDWDPVTDTEKNMQANPLDPGSGAVVLFKRGQIDVLERQSLFWTTAIQTYTRIKILNEAGREYANVSVESSKYMRLSKVEGRTILPSGQIIPLDSSQVFRGRAYETGGRDFSIQKTSFSFPSVAPGAIIEYQIVETADWFYPPPWTFDTRELGTLQSTLKVTIGPRLAMAQYPLETTVNKIAVAQSQVARGTETNFTVQNLRPVRQEPFSVPFRDQATMVIFSPSQMAFQNQVYPIITKWDDVGTQFTEMMGTMGKQDKETGKKAKEIAGNLPDDRKRAEAIYTYLQQNISSSHLIGVGLGRTADQIMIDKRGDPDEINALFVMMLKDVKVEAEPVLIAGHNYMTLVGSFPNFSQFSGLITRVNLKSGAIFTDPAADGAPFGELPWFEKGLQGLAVKGNKIQDAQIPAGSQDDNLSVTKVSLQVSPDWKAEGEVEVDMKGAEAIRFRSDLIDESPEKVEERLSDYFTYGHSDASVSAIVHPSFRDSSQPMVLKAHLQASLSDEAGTDKILLNPWLDDRYVSPIFKATERHSAVRFDNPEKRVSTSTWELPAEIKVEQLPATVNIENDLGSFSHSCTQSANTVTCTRTFALKKMLLQTTTEYLGARKFFDEIAKNDQEVMVLGGK
jgi:hypothetical protein